MLTDDQRRVLTEEVLGECWHTMRSSQYLSFPDRCLSCDKLISSLDRRTFSSWQDLGDLKEKIVEMGEWEALIHNLVYLYYDYNSLYNSAPVFTNWLFDPARFAELVATWWTERKE